MRVIKNPDALIIILNERKEELKATMSGRSDDEAVKRLQLVSSYVTVLNDIIDLAIEQGTMQKLDIG